MIIEFVKKCPKCSKNIYFKSKYGLKQSIENNSRCKSCCVDIRGEKNGMFGRKHTKKSLEKISVNTKKGMYVPKVRKKFLEIKKSKTYRNNLSKALINRELSNETINKMRKSAIKLVEKQGFAASSFNPNACQLIDKYGKENGYKFQRALNGGEFKIKIGSKHYYLDGYDRDKNVAIEIDEKYHRYQKEKDIKRQKEIEEILNCKFIRLPYEENK